MSVKAGRAFWTLGYLNEHHSHTDDFADRPLPYRVFFNQAFNDDGAEVSYVLATDFYSEIGGGLFRETISLSAALRAEALAPGPLLPALAVTSVTIKAGD